MNSTSQLPAQQSFPHGQVEALHPAWALTEQADGALAVPTPWRIRGFIAGRTVLDSSAAFLLYAPKSHVPLYAVPLAHLAADAFEDDPDPPTRSTSFGLAQVRQLRAPEADGAPRRPRRVRVYEQLALNDRSPRPDAGPMVVFGWESVDEWFEEDERVFGHPRDPFHRIDTHASSRRVRVTAGGELVADTTSAVLLAETGLPLRYYLPRADVRLDLLEPSDTTTWCAYKGQANYYHLRVGDRLIRDAVWYYRFPSHEHAQLRDLLAFYPELMDDISVETP